MTYHLDEPAAGPGAFPQFVVAALARQHVKVVLGGQGGDEVFGGYARYLLMYLEESLKGSIFGSQDPQRHIVTLGRVLPNLGMLEEYVPLLKEFWSKGVFDAPERRYYSLVARYGALAAALTVDFRKQRDESAIFAAFEAQFNEILGHVPSGGSALLNRMTSYDLRTGLQALLHVEDRMSMAWGLESRLPFLDHRIVELAFRMPPLFKYRDGKAKSALLAAVKNVIPDAVGNRRDKKGFPVPFVEWTHGPLRGLVTDILLGRRARQRGIFEAEGVERMLQDERPFGRSLWGLLSLETWYQTFIDEAPSQTLTADVSKLEALGTH
jgi:asparagine synthase (glutamine-hydrolysing)